MPTIDPILSVLVPSVPSRVIHQLLPLLERLNEQAQGKPVEILCLLDNKARSVGLKREALVQASRGKFVAFVDDDDDVTPHYVEKILAAAEANPDADCIVFDQLCTLNDQEPVVVRHGIEFENTEVGPQGATRKPWHVMAYAGRIARACHFPDASWGEDWEWVKQAWPQIKKQVRIDAVLHHYRFSSATTEAELTFPPGHKP